MNNIINSLSQNKPIPEHSENRLNFDAKNFTFAGEESEKSVSLMTTQQKINYYKKFWHEIYKKYLLQLAQKYQEQDYQNLVKQLQNINAQLYSAQYPHTFKIQEEVEKTLCSILDDFLTRRGYDINDYTNS